MRRLLNRKNQQNEEQIRFFDITASLIIGGVSKSTQARFLREKNSILVCTPGRMLDHLVNTEFNFSNLQFLVFDECDRLLSQGFEDEINQLLNILGVRSESASKRKRKNKKKGGEGRGGEGDEEEGNKKKIQTILFSATVDDKVLQLIDERLSKEREEVLLNSRLRSAAEEEEEESEGMDDATTVSNLNQGYICVEPDLKLASLYMLLKKYHKRNKIMVFFSSCNAVKFHSDILNYLNIPCFNIFGKLKQSQRTNTFLQFSQAEQGVLLCTNIGSRGWDIPHVNIVIQYDPPEEVDEYIHRVGRTCRGESSSSSSSSQQQQQQHRSILFLLPNELPFVEYLAEAHHVHSLQAYQLANSDQGMGGKLRALATQCQQLIAQNYYLYNSAKQAYKSYVLAYKSYKYKRDGKGNLLFNVFDLDLQKIAFAYGFQVPPKVNLNLSMRGHKKARGKQQQQHGTGNNHYEISSQPFLASNPKGRREASDKRQFSK
jgi:ATP-dependent RNA helicase DDX18/HAS1